MKGSSFVIWSKALTKVRFLPAPRDWEMGAVSLDVYISKRCLLVLEKDIPRPDS